MQARSALMVRMVKDTEGLAAYFLREKPIQTLLGDANKDAVRNFEKSMDLAAVTLSVSIRHMMSASKMAAHNQAGRRSNARTAGSTVADLANSAEAFVELEEDDMIQRFVILHARTHARTHARMHERTRACTIEARTHARSARARTHARTHARPPARSPAARPPARPPAGTHARTHSRTHARTHACTTDARTCRRAHARTRAAVSAHARTHTHALPAATYVSATQPRPLSFSLTLTRLLLRVCMGAYVNS
jgi:hypothetical protein